MPQYILRLDDACEKRDITKWDRIEQLLDNFSIKPLVGIIPHCEDPKMNDFPYDELFWERVYSWKNKGWTLALHGYNHVYNTCSGGINPVNRRSEFAGNQLCIQRQKIKDGIDIFRSHGIEPQVFFAPSHTFDENTLSALLTESNIRVISDTIAFDVYKDGEFVFVPQQSGRARVLPFRTITFCYHPNTMDDKSFNDLSKFLKLYSNDFVCFEEIIKGITREKSSIDKILSNIYMRMHS